MYKSIKAKCRLGKCMIAEKYIINTVLQIEKKSGVILTVATE